MERKLRAKYKEPKGFENRQKSNKIIIKNNNKIIIIILKNSLTPKTTGWSPHLDLHKVADCKCWKRSYTSSVVFFFFFF